MSTNLASLSARRVQGNQPVFFVIICVNIAYQRISLTLLFMEYGSVGELNFTGDSMATTLFRFVIKNIFDAIADILGTRYQSSFLYMPSAY